MNLHSNIHIVLLIGLIWGKIIWFFKIKKDTFIYQEVIVAIVFYSTSLLYWISLYPFHLNSQFQLHCLQNLRKTIVCSYEKL